MAKLKCRICENSMSNTNVPSENIINIYTKKEVDTFKSNQNMLLIDFENIDRDYEYWFCPNCQTIHQVENTSCGKVIASFLKVENTTFIDKKNIELEEIYIFSETELYNAEEDEEILVNFIEDKGLSHLYFIDKNKQKIYQQNENGKLILMYQQT